MAYGGSTVSKLNTGATNLAGTIGNTIGATTIVGSTIGDIGKGNGGVLSGNLTSGVGNALSTVATNAFAGLGTDLNKVTNNITAGNVMPGLSNLLNGGGGGGGGGSTPASPTVAPVTPTQPSLPTTPQSAIQATFGLGQSGGAQTIGQTLLTGAGGVDPNQLTLGKYTLLGNTGGNNG